MCVQSVKWASSNHVHVLLIPPSGSKPVWSGYCDAMLWDVKKAHLAWTGLRLVALFYVNATRHALNNPSERLEEWITHREFKTRRKIKMIWTLKKKAIMYLSWWFKLITQPQHGDKTNTGAFAHWVRTMHHNRWLFLDSCLSASVSTASTPHLSSSLICTNDRWPLWVGETDCLQLSMSSQACPGGADCACVLWAYWNIWYLIPSDKQRCRNSNGRTG